MGLKATIRAPLRAIVFDVQRYPPLAKPSWPDDLRAEEVELYRLTGSLQTYRLVRPYIVTSPGGRLRARERQPRRAGFHLSPAL